MLMGDESGAGGVDLPAEIELETYEDEAGEYRWRVWRGIEIIGASEEGYPTEFEAEEAAWDLWSALSVIFGFGQADEVERDVFVNLISQDMGRAPKVAMAAAKAAAIEYRLHQGRYRDK